MGRNRFAGEPFEDDDEAIARALEDVSIPALHVLARAHERRPVVGRGDIRPTWRISLDIQRGDVGGGHGRGAPPRPAGHRRLPRRRVRAGGAAPGAVAGDDGFPRPPAGRGPAGRPLLRRPAVRGGRQRGDLLGRRDPGSAEGRVARRRHRLRHGRDPGRHPPHSRPGCPSRSSRRTRARAARGGRTATPARASTSGATSTASPSSRPTTGASTTASSPSCAPTSARSSTSTDLRPHCRFGTAVTEVVWDEDRPLWRVAGARAPSGAEDVLDARFVISAVGSLNLPRMPEIPGMETFAGPSFHSARWPEDLDIRGTQVRARRRRRERVPDRPGHRRGGRAAHDLPAHGPVDPPQPAVPHAGAAGRRVGAAPPAVLRALVPLHHDLRRHRGGDGAVPHRPRARRPDPPVGQSPSTRSRATALLASMRSHRRRRPRPAREGRPRLPRHGQAHPAGRRHLAAHACSSRTSSSSGPASSGSSPTASSRRTDGTIRPTSSVTPPGSATTSSWPP